MKPSIRIEQLAKKYILETERALQANPETKGMRIGEEHVAIILSRAITDYLDEEWEKKPGVVLP